MGMKWNEIAERCEIRKLNIIRSYEGVGDEI